MSSAPRSLILIWKWPGGGFISTGIPVTASPAIARSVHCAPGCLCRERTAGEGSISPINGWIPPLVCAAPDLVIVQWLKLLCCLSSGQDGKSLSVFGYYGRHNNHSKPCVGGENATAKEFSGKLGQGFRMTLFRAITLMSVWHHPRVDWRCNFGRAIFRLGQFMLAPPVWGFVNCGITLFLPFFLAVDVFICFSLKADSSLLSVCPLYVKVDLSPALMARLVLDRFLQGLEGETRE